MTMQSGFGADFTDNIFGGNPNFQNIGDLFADLETDPLGRQVLFQSFAPTGGPQNARTRNQYSRLFEPSFNQFLGELGGQIRSGQNPTLLFGEFLQNQFDPTRQFLQRGLYSGPRQGPTQFRF